MRAILLRLLLVLLIVSPLIGGGIWIYNASAAAFALQHTIRDAQNLRGNLVRILLAKESDVRGFAATRSPFFAAEYQQNSDLFSNDEKQLVGELHQIDPFYDTKALVDEMALYHAWEKNIAGPILSERPGVVEPLLRKSDPLFSSEFLREDSKIQDFLNDAVSLSELHRQTLLRRILLSSIALVISAALVVGSFLWLTQRSEQSRIIHALQLREERRLTEKLQRSLMPDRLPLIPGVHLEAIYVPAAIEHLVGGDWYDVVELSAHRLLCIIGDVAGHGLDAAALMNRARHSIVTAALIESDPAAILARANSLITEFHGHMVTALCGILDLGRKEFTYATAGHPAPVIAKPGLSAHSLAAGGPPLGIFPTIALTSTSVHLDAGDCIYLFTDGLIENERDVIGGSERLVAGAVFAAAQENPATALFQAIVRAAQPSDDAAVLAISILHDTPPR